jgi:hypothetical protein
MKPTAKGHPDRRARSPRAFTSYPPDQSEASVDPENYPEIPYDDPAWDDPDTWVLGCWLPAGTVLKDPSSGFRFIVGRTKGGSR